MARLGMKSVFLVASASPSMAGYFGRRKLPNTRILYCLRKDLWSGVLRQYPKGDNTLGHLACSKNRLAPKKGASGSVGGSAVAKLLLRGDRL